MTRVARLLVLSLALTGMLAVPRVLTRPAQGQTGCHGASLTGPYGLGASGTLLAVPGATVATLVFDGRGTISPTHLVLSVGGTPDPVDVTGTYDLDPDCTGKLVIQTAHHNPPRTHYHDADLVVVNGGNEAFVVVGGPKDSPSDSATPGEVFTGVLKRL
jgi:hypothetical protein